MAPSCLSQIQILTLAFKILHYRTLAHFTVLSLVNLIQSVLPPNLSVFPEHAVTHAIPSACMPWLLSVPLRTDPILQDRAQILPSLRGFS